MLAMKLPLRKDMPRRCFDAHTESQCVEGTFHHWTCTHLRDGGTWENCLSAITKEKPCRFGKDILYLKPTNSTID